MNSIISLRLFRLKIFRLQVSTGRNRTKKREKTTRESDEKTKEIILEQSFM